MKNSKFVQTFVILALFYSVQASGKQEGNYLEAIAVIDGSNGKVKGNVSFIQNQHTNSIDVEVHMEGLTPGKHGFHIHEKGDLTKACLSTGSHYNPDNLDHGGPTSEIRHEGDLGNLVANSYGIVSDKLSYSSITLVGKRSIIGRAVVVHTDEDDFGLGQSPDSKKTGNAGGRAGCGIIGIK